MVKFPYLLSYSLNPVEITEAEKLLAEYSDFYVFNQAQYLGTKKDESGDKEIDNDDDTVTDKDNAVLEKISFDDEKDFSKLWGSRDFASAALMGMSVEWDVLQEILIKEQERGVHPKDSQLNATARKLRCVASILTFANKIIDALGDKHADAGMIKLIHSGFEMLLEELAEREFEFPEYETEKKNFRKIKTVDKLIDYAKSIFAFGKR